VGERVASKRSGSRRSVKNAIAMKSGTHTHTYDEDHGNAPRDLYTPEMINEL
jgi:hypothetical protein